MRKELIEALYREMYKAMVEKDTATLNSVHADNTILYKLATIRKHRGSFVRLCKLGNKSHLLPSSK